MALLSRWEWELGQAILIFIQPLPLCSKEGGQGIRVQQVTKAQRTVALWQPWLVENTHTQTHINSYSLITSVITAGLEVKRIFLLWFCFYIALFNKLEYLTLLPLVSWSGWSSEAPSNLNYHPMTPKGTQSLSPRSQIALGLDWFLSSLAKQY